MTDTEARYHVIESPLNAWEGSVSLPHPDEFSGAHWRTWRTAAEKPLRKSYSLIHQNFYAGLELIKLHGDWNLSVGLAECQAWETDPDAERVKLVGWLGRALWEYMQSVIDPKD